MYPWIIMISSHSGSSFHGVTRCDEEEIHRYHHHLRHFLISFVVYHPLQTAKRKRKSFLGSCYIMSSWWWGDEERDITMFKHAKRAKETFFSLFYPNDPHDDDDETSFFSTTSLFVRFALFFVFDGTFMFFVPGSSFSWSSQPPVDDGSFDSFPTNDVRCSCWSSVT